MKKTFLIFLSLLIWGCGEPRSDSETRFRPAQDLGTASLELPAGSRLLYLKEIPASGQFYCHWIEIETSTDESIDFIEYHYAVDSDSCRGFVKENPLKMTYLREELSLQSETRADVDYFLPQKFVGKGLDIEVELLGEKYEAAEYALNQSQRASFAQYVAASGPLQNVLVKQVVRTGDIGLKGHFIQTLIEHQKP